ncbi:hypothetical protein MNEG_12524 [Monoraphidium neglectum]|uniref:PB1 domain-containing protein n=1 Tax=Monoraphidium neglectum TaxID=145388 RepID=A0A0D2MKJ3_9CHLO|nr:hypothetical protein MNEG_12524 [Monoraphidium neglectum]KIY95440.1 hypothetical protein MNEG_12524 [Monoraphidium neglectum]|eukprot:XP_013894460.1 hypothetical protein MNEG_12524 [Monoraphidium neglectum]
MGKTKAAKASPRAAPAEVSEEVRSKVDALVNDGNKAFAKREYTKALESFGAAAKALPEAAADKANLLCNKAACYYQLKRFKEAAKECSNALDIAPNSAKALQRRARSLEQQGLYKQALSDIQAALAVPKTDAATDESRDIERRLRDAVAGRRPAGLGAALAPSPAPPANGAARAAAAAQAAAAAAQQQQRQAQLQAQQQQAQAQAQQQRQVFTLSAKVTLGEETRQLSLTASTSYAQLLELVHAKFPEAGPFQLKYTDKEGDSITITSRVDVRAAVQDLVASAAQPKGGVPPILPPLRLALVPCAEADVPRPPQEEALQAEALRRSHEAAAAKIALQRRQAAAEREAAAAAAAAAAGAPQVATTPGGEVVEIDDWLIDFANLFRDVSGVDAERHVEIQNEGTSRKAVS